LKAIVFGTASAQDGSAVSRDGSCRDMFAMSERQQRDASFGEGPAPAHGPIISEIVAKRSRSLFIGCFANHQDT
jgi:hypothetical protein